MRIKWLSGFLLVLSLGVLAGCEATVGGSQGRQLTSITVTPSGAGVAVGNQQQFTATGTYSDGSQRNIGPLVTWNSSPAGLITIDSSGLATAVAAGQVTVTATANSISGSAPLTVNPPIVVSVAVTPHSPGIVVSGAQQMTAIATYSDQSTQDITSSAAWASSAPSVASVDSSGMVSGSQAGQTVVTATFSAISDSTVINVVASPYAGAALNGNYAFIISNVDARGPQYFVGNFHADGSGRIDSGEVDSNTSAGVDNEPVTGTYTVDADGRGDLILNATGLPSSTYRFLLTTNGTAGQFIEFDGLGAASGSFEKQDPTAFDLAQLNGNYVFRFKGIDNLASPLGKVGVFTTDGTGAITAGTEDVNDFGVVTAPDNFTGSLQAVDANGRSVVTLNFGTGATDFVGYVVSANKLYLLSKDPASALLGSAELQAAQVFTAASLKGPYGFLLERAQGQTRGSFDAVGSTVFAGNLVVSGGQQDEISSGGHAGGTNNIISGSYSLPDQNMGRTVVTEDTDFGSREYVYYLISPNRAFILDIFDSAAASGFGDIQAVGLNNTTLAGTYGFAAADFAGGATNALWQITADGAGGVTGLGDVVDNGVVSSGIVSLSNNYTVNPNGKTALQLANPVGTTELIFYVVSNSESLMLGTTPQFDGTVAIQ